MRFAGTDLWWVQCEDDRNEGDNVMPLQRQFDQVGV